LRCPFHHYGMLLALVAELITGFGFPVGSLPYYNLAIKLQFLSYYSSFRNYPISSRLPQHPLLARPNRRARRRVIEESYRPIHSIRCEIVSFYALWRSDAWIPNCIHARELNCWSWITWNKHIRQRSLKFQMKWILTSSRANNVDMGAIDVKLRSRVLLLSTVVFLCCILIGYLKKKGKREKQEHEL